MASNLQHEDLLMKLRAKLNDEKIKLWEAPYYNEATGSDTNVLEELANTFATSLQLEYTVILSALRELQRHSLDRVRANTEFKESGLATLRVRVSMVTEGLKVLNVQVKLNVEGKELIAIVAKDLSVHASQIKLITNGKVLKPSSSLEEQGCKNGSQILALVMAETPEQVKQEDDMYMEMKCTREDATLLTEYVDDLGNDDEFLQLEDQSGNTVNLPPSEKKALLVGLTLHEKGRVAMKEQNYSLALVLLLEADRYFSECNSSVLSSVDNVALLQLDISWCYVCLQSVSAAPDAANRLFRAEQSLMKSYGPNLERLLALKGNVANERTILMRLHLLQAIVNYHQNRRSEAKVLLDKAEGELDSLKVDDNSVAMLVSLGWSPSQARTGLRAVNNDINAADNYLNKIKEDKKKARAAAKKERIKRSLGQCLDGQYVNEQFVELLINMGYNRKTAILALKNSNNHVSEAVRIIQEEPHLICGGNEFDDDMSNESNESLTIDKTLIAQLSSMGYTSDMVVRALKECNNNLEDAFEYLVANCMAQLSQGNSEGNPSTSRAINASSTPKRHKSERKKRREMQEAAFERLQRALSNKDDEYLDTPLIEEEELMNKYKALIN